MLFDYKKRSILAVLILSLFLGQLSFAQDQKEEFYIQNEYIEKIDIQIEDSNIEKSSSVYWRYRYIQGRRQKRLWNNSTQRWLTNWIWG